MDLFGTKVDVATMDETVQKIMTRIDRQQFTQHVVVNVAKLVNMQSDEALAAAVSGCDIINIDGMGVVWGARALGYRIPERIAGIDLFDRLLSAAASRRYPVFFLGATEAVLASAVEQCRARYRSLEIAGSHHGYFWGNERDVADVIRRSGARLLFVAITSPKKERFINDWGRELGVDFVMGVGGTFDVVAGKVRRAPLWMQRCGLEWFFRVLQEPRRMWKRYLITNSAFLFMVGKAWISPRRS
ncbi:WecB/TagA/CpsF family glycosyltransferase [Paraburkholderia silviterrae]|uniref:WecB/TagA/CpsF family glycosyltransferase n=1 Tax=Paraburkholderia silviterrae TaxID=2528715 RepID=UPI0023EA6E13|nr:WecB/TagA/CpsF family glycosyltransferase [Paraburkholderia silviterrae]